MDKNRINRELYRLLGYEGKKPYPDYVENPFLVLQEMRSRDDYEFFLTYIHDPEWSHVEVKYFILSGTYLLQLLDLILLDKTGQLAKDARRWLKTGRIKYAKDTFSE